MKLELLAPILLLVIAIVVMLGLGFIFYYRTWKQINKFHRASGLVVDLTARHSDEMGSYSPIVRFTALDDQEIEFEDHRANEKPDFKIGQQVIVLYNPKNFKKARVLTSKWNMYYSSILLIGLGTVFLLSGVLMAVVFGTFYAFGVMEKD